MKIQKLNPPDGWGAPFMLEQVGGVWVCMGMDQNVHSARTDQTVRTFCVTEFGRVARHVLYPSAEVRHGASALISRATFIADETITFGALRPSRFAKEVTLTCLNLNTDKITSPNVMVSQDMQPPWYGKAEKGLYYDSQDSLAVYTPQVLNQESAKILFGVDCENRKIVVVTNRSKTRTVEIPDVDNVSMPRLSADRLTMACLGFVTDDSSSPTRLITLDLVFFYDG